MHPLTQRQCFSCHLKGTHTLCYTDAQIEKLREAAYSNFKHFNACYSNVTAANIVVLVSNKTKLLTGQREQNQALHQTILLNIDCCNLLDLKNNIEL